ncbi:MAG: HD domain-containing protein [Ktedonobacteraceae bacterium]
MEQTPYRTEILPLVYTEVEQRYAGISDLAHGWEHVSRVYTLALHIAQEEGADRFVVAMAALLHDLGHTAEDSQEAQSTPDTQNKPEARATHHASSSVALATELMRKHGLPADVEQAITHAILAHSFSLGVEPQTLEARVVRDADRLDALGALGIMRWSIVGAQRSTQRTRTYNPADPFAEQRPPDDRTYMLDHFFVKLFKLADTMTTTTGQALAQQRTAFMRSFLHELKSELELA